MRACKQRQHDSELINDDDYADLKRIVISEAKKTFEATKAAKRRRTLDLASEFSTPPPKAGVPSCTDWSPALSSSPATPEPREWVTAFFSQASYSRSRPETSQKPPPKIARGNCDINIAPQLVNMSQNGAKRGKPESQMHK